MTVEEQRLAHDRMRGEIAKLFEKTRAIAARNGIASQHHHAEKACLVAETRHMGVQTLVAPFTAAAVVKGATAALVKLFFG